MNFDLYKALRNNSLAQTPVEQAVLLCLAAYARDKEPVGVAWPSVATIAKETRFCRSAVFLALKALKAYGHLAPFAGSIPDCKTNGGATRYLVSAAVSGARATRPSGGRVQQVDGSTARTPPVHHVDFTRPRGGPNDLKKTKGLPKPRAARSEPEAFTRFYALYPKKEDRKKALAAWMALRPDAELIERILGAVATRAKSAKWLEKDGEFVPSPFRWLRDERWEDVIAQPAGAAARDLPDTTAWRRDCQHSPACRNEFEHESRIEAQRVSA